jgi:hypothetical protein
MANFKAHEGTEMQVDSFIINCISLGGEAPFKWPSPNFVVGLLALLIRIL